MLDNIWVLLDFVTYMCEDEKKKGRVTRQMQDSVLDFSIKVLEWNNVQIQQLELEVVWDESKYDKGLRSDLPGMEPVSSRLSLVLQSVQPQTLYHITDFFGCLYTAFLLEEKQMLLIGPSLTFCENDIFTEKRCR